MIIALLYISWFLKSVTRQDITADAATIYSKTL